MNKAVFIDKDGTLIKDVPFNVDTRKIVLEMGVLEGLRLLQARGYLLLVITNQPGIAFGYYQDPDLWNAYNFLCTLLQMEGIQLQGIYYCPHAPVPASSGKAGCDCRKPAPGLLFTAAGQRHIDLHRSWMIGDILNDVEAGNRAGCRTILIDNGNETRWEQGPFRQPAYLVNNFLQAAEIICHLDQS